MERNKNNRVLFKYGHLAEPDGSVKCGRLKQFCAMFLKNKLYFSDPSKFNDPFEFKPRLIINDYEKARKKLEATIIKDGCPADEAKRISLDRSSDPRFEAMMGDAYRKHIIKSGVFCLTPKWDNQLMWAHYADGHRGYCLVFVFKKDSQEINKLKKVEYPDEYPEFVVEDEDYENSGNKSCLSKSKCWKYEEEYRLLSPYEGYLDSPTNALEGIIFGCKMKNEIKDMIVKLNNKRDRQLRLNETYLDPKEYAIRIRDYNFQR